MFRLRSYDINIEYVYKFRQGRPTAKNSEERNEKETNKTKKRIKKLYMLTMAIFVVCAVALPGNTHFCDKKWNEEYMANIISNILFGKNMKLRKSRNLICLFSDNKIWLRKMLYMDSGGSPH